MLTTVATASGRKLRPDDPLPPGSSSVRLAAARNEVALGQLVVRSDRATTDLAVAAEVLTGPPGSGPIGVELLRQHYVLVREPTTPAFEPGWYPDGLVPLSGPLDLEADRNQSVWVRAAVPEDQQPGTYRGTVRIGDQVAEVVLEVRDLTLPVATHCRSAFAIWYDQLADHYGLAAGSAEHWAMAERFYWFQLDRRLPPDDLPLPSVLGAEEWLERAARFLTDPRVTSYRVPFRATDPAFNEAVAAGLRERGWLDRGYYYLDEIDEPTAGGIAQPEGGDSRVEELCRELAALAPEVPHLVTAEPVPELRGAPKVWTPLFDRYDPVDAATRRAAGERFWWYGCVYPMHPHPTYHIDDDLVAARIVPWMMYRYRIEGNLYWSTTIYGKWHEDRFVERDPWTDPGAWPRVNGDGYLMYPGPDGPLSSIRLEAVRAGQEDYEYLWLLEQALRDAASRAGLADHDPRPVVDAYCDRLFRSTSDFTRDPDEVDRVRDEVAAEILRLRQPGAEPPAAAAPAAATAPATGVPTELPAGRWEAHLLALEAAADGMLVRTGDVGEDRPALRWRGDHQWGPDDVLEVDVDNHGARSTAVFVTLRHRDGREHEAVRAMAVAGERRTIRVPVRLGLFPPQDVVGFEIGAMRHQPAAVLTLSGFRVTR